MEAEVQPQALPQEAPQGAPQDTPQAIEIEIDHLADAPERSLVTTAAAAARAREPLKLRMPLQLWNPEAKPYGAYRGWRGQSWILSLRGIEDARRVQEIMAKLFDLIEGAGTEKVLEAMKTLRDDQTNKDKAA